MDYELKEEIYYRSKEYMIEKLNDFNFFIQNENETEEHFGSLYFEMNNKTEEVRFILDNRDNCFVLENKKSNSWDQLACVSIVGEKDQILKQLRGKINNFIRLDLL